MDKSSSHGTGLQKGTLGAWFITLLVVSAASPLSVLAGGFSVGMLLGNGAGTPALVIVALAVLLLFAAGYTALAAHLTNAGGFYAMIARGLNGHAGGMAAMVAVLGYLTLQFALYGLLGGVTSEALLAQFGWTVPWWWCSLLALSCVALLGYRQIDFSARVIAICVVAEYITVIVLDVLILKSGGAHGIDLKAYSPAVVGSGNPFIGLLFCFAAFIGFESTTIYSEEARDPKRTIPIATYAALLLVGGFYSFSLWCLVVGAGADDLLKTIAALSDPTNFIYLMSDKYGGAPMTVALRWMFIASILSGLIAFHNATARYLYAMGREGLLPAYFGWTHVRHKSPHIASFIQSAVCLAVIAPFIAAGVDPVLTLFSWLSSIATVCVLVLMLITAIAIVFYFHRTPHQHHRFRTVVAPILSAIGFTMVLVLAVHHFEALTGESGVSRILLGMVPVAAALGWFCANRLASRNPVRFSMLGKDRD